MGQGLLPPPWDEDLPRELQETLVRSHVEFEKGWKGISLGDYLKVLVDCQGLDVIRAVYERTLIYRKIWTHIDCIIGPWTYPAGHGVSQGFNYTCANPDAFLSAMRHPTAPFCEDLFNVHGEKDCFRELVSGGAGLHVCITRPAARATERHDIHIDRYQVVCSRLPDGHCNYAVATPGAVQNMSDHMKEAIPWMLGEERKKVEKRAKEELQRLKDMKELFLGDPSKVIPRPKGPEGKGNS